jgi:hypothetical protein
MLRPVKEVRFPSKGQKTSLGWEAHCDRDGLMLPDLKIEVWAPKWLKD